MALSEPVVINPDHVAEGDGTIQNAMQLWSCRNGPVNYNKWQSVYFALRRQGLRDPERPDDESQAQLQKRLRTMYDQIQEEFHGTDFKAQLLLAARGEDPQQQTTALQLVAAPKLRPRGDTAEAMADDQASVREAYDIYTPFGYEDNQPDPASPDRLYYQRATQDLVRDLDPTHTEATDECEERMNQLIEKLAQVEANPEGRRFVLDVEKLVRDYTTFYGDWMRADPLERARVSLKLFAMEKLNELTAEPFSSQSELKRHVYALGRLAERPPEASRALIRSLWNASYDAGEPMGESPDLPTTPPQRARPASVEECYSSTPAGPASRFPSPVQMQASPGGASSANQDVINAVGVMTDGFQQAMGKVVEKFTESVGKDGTTHSGKRRGGLSGLELKHVLPTIFDDDANLDSHNTQFFDTIACYSFGEDAPRDIDVLHLYGKTFPVGSTRRQVYENAMRRERRNKRIPEHSKKVLDELVVELETYIWETGLQKLTRLDREYAMLEQGVMSHADFRALWVSCRIWRKQKWKCQLRLPSTATTSIRFSTRPGLGSCRRSGR